VLRLILRFLVPLLLLVPVVAAQVSPDLEQGMKPYGSYHGGAIDQVSLTNQNLTLQAPLFAYSQRGGELAYPIVLRYNNKNFSLYQAPCSPGTKLGTTQCPLRLKVIFGPAPFGPATTSHGASVTAGFEGYPTTGATRIDTSLSFDGNEIFVSPNSVLTPDGSVHQLVQTNNGMVAADGSGYSSPGLLTATDRKGTIYAQASLAEDRNGNKISLSNSIWTDTLGRQIPVAPGPSSPSVTPPASTASLGACPALNYANQPVIAAYLWNVPTINGGTLPLILCYSSVYVRTNFLGGAQGPNIFDVSQTFYMLQSVVLPDNTYWAFQYDAADPNNTGSFAFGDLLKVTFPTTGSLTYTWTSNGYCQSGFSRSVQTRTVDANDGTGPYIWRYNGGIVSDPAGNDTVHTITGLGGTCSLYETQTQYYQGSQTGGTLLKTVNTDYQYTINPYDSVVIGGGQQADATSVTNVFPIRVTTTLPNGLVSKVETDYDTALAYHGPLDGITSNIKECPATDPGGNDNSDCHYYFYGDQSTVGTTNYTGSYGKAVATREYDWGQGAPGPLLRRTVYSYQWQTGPNAASYLSNNFLDLVSSTTVYDGAGNRVAASTYGYDESSLGSSSVGSTLRDPNPPNGLIRGNQTTVNHWLNTSNTYLSSQATYNDAGELLSSTDPGLHTTTHLYDLAYQGAFSTQTCSPSTSGGTVTHCVSGTYDFDTGLLTSLTNENATQQASGNSPGDAAHTSSFAYDTFWRLTQALAPPDLANGSAQASTTFAYPPLASSPRVVTRQKSITLGLPDVANATFDGLGRPYLSDHFTSSGAAEVLTTYDALGRPATVTNPYYVGTPHSSDPTYGVTQTQFDALGRTTQVTRQDGSISSVSYSGNCTTSTDEASKERKSCSDALGRLVEVDEPGPGVNTAGTPGSGNITISGSLQSSTSSGAKATGWFTVSGTEIGLRPWICLDTCVRGPFVWDSGTVSLTINGVTVSAPYGQNSTASSIANSLAAQFANMASNPGAGTTSNLTADQPGPNYSLSTSSSTNDPTDFGSASFSVGLSGSALTGGVYPSTIYDSGAVTVTVNGFQASAAYNQNLNNNPTAMATALAAALNAAGSPVAASASGTTITITARGNGAATNYSVSGGSGTSFTASSTTLAGGTDPGGLFAPYVTLYQYDALGNLLRVDQKGSAPSDSTQWRTRTFTYDSLSRLLAASNPESGTITYSYDADGNLLQKTSPAPNQTGTATQTVSYCYDALHRVTGKGYGAQSCPLAAPVVTYVYDSGTNAIGHLTSLTDQAGTASYAYDILGRLTAETRTLTGANNAAISKNLSYEYNLDGSLYKLHYPSGNVVTYTPDSAGRTLSAIDSGNGINYVTGATYGPDSALTGFISGYSASFAGITNAFSYNKRLQPLTMSANAPSQTVFSIGYDFHLGNGSSGADNGNVYGITNYKDQNRNQIFTYDPLNRLISAQNAGTNCAATVIGGKSEYWGNSYGYDAWGNLLQKSVTKCGAENLVVTADSHNWIHASGTDYQYDAAGNMTFNATPPTQNYTYDQENRLTGAAGYAYTYDGDGNRVRKSSSSTTGTLYWYMTPGIVGESDLSGNLTDEYVFFDGERIARKSTNGVFYYFSDHLKTASVITDSSGNIKSESDFYPWGGELQFVANDSNHYKFTGKERDSETQLDYFGARYYSNGLGRWVSADWSPTPIPVPYADFGDPQSLNLYQFVGGNPASKADPDGHWPTLLAPVAEAAKDTVIVIGAEPVIIVVGVLSAAHFLDQMINPPSVGQSNADEQAAIQQGSQERAAQNGGVDPQQTPAPAAASGGARKGGGKAYEPTKGNLDEMKQGKPPVGADGKKVELHHDGQTTQSPLVEMTQTQHRGKGNFTQNHQNTGQKRSQVNRNQAAKTRRQHWKNEHKKHTGGN
jgi:RHS repeat-associated protein